MLKNDRCIIFNLEIITNGIPQAYALYFERNLTIDPEVCYPIILLRIEVG